MSVLLGLVENLVAKGADGTGVSPDAEVVGVDGETPASKRARLIRRMRIQVSCGRLRGVGVCDCETDVAASGMGRSHSGFVHCFGDRSGFHRCCECTLQDLAPLQRGGTTLVISDLVIHGIADKAELTESVFIVFHNIE